MTKKISTPMKPPGIASGKAWKHDDQHHRDGAKAVNIRPISI